MCGALLDLNESVWGVTIDISQAEHNLLEHDRVGASMSTDLN